MNDLDRKRIGDVSDYLKGEYVRYQGKFVGRGQSLPSQKDFAKYLGISPTIYSYIINLERLPTVERADAIASKLGPKIYEMADYSPRVGGNRLLQLVVKRWHLLSESKQKQFAEAIENETFEDERKNKKDMTGSMA